MEEIQSVYECVKEFLCDEYDDDGNELEEEFRSVKKGSRWEVEWVANGWVKLYEMTDETIYSWLEISLEHLTTHFEIVK